MKVAPRNLFFDEQGKRRYKRREILNEAGDLRPGCRIVSKGEVYEQRFFGAADPQFHFKSWLEAAKREWLLPLLNGPLRSDVEYRLFDYSQGKLPQQHIGKNLLPEQKAVVQEYNELVREYNRAIDAGKISPEKAQVIQEHVMASPNRYETLFREFDVLMYQKSSIEMAPKAPVRPLGKEPQGNLYREEENTLTEPLRVSIPEERPSVRAQLQQIQKKRREMRLISPEEKLAREIFSLTLQYNPSKVIPPEKRQQVIKAFTRDIKQGNTGYILP